MRRTPVIVLILLLIPAYIGVVQALPMAVRSTCTPAGESVTVTDRVGFCERIGFSVERSYYLGLLRLPVYPAGLSVDLINRLFLPLFLGLAGLVWWRGRDEDRAVQESVFDAGGDGERETVTVTTQ